MDKLDNLYFFSPTSIRIPLELYEQIDADAWRFGFRKNNKSNINGFLNELLPSLANYREQASNLISNITDVDDDLSKKLIAGALSFDALQLSCIKDTGINISFRINKTHLNDFIDIIYNDLRNFDIDFSAFVRSVLIDYASKRLSVRERLFYFKQWQVIVSALNKKQSCFFVLKNLTSHLVPIKIITSPYNDHNVIFGINIKNKKAQMLYLNSITSVCKQENHVEISNHDIQALQTTITDFLKNEKSRTI